MRIQSMTAAKPLTSVMGLPLESANGQTWVAREMSAPSGSAARSSWRKVRKFAESDPDTALLPAPCTPGYSQSISIPSRLYELYAARMFLTNVFLAEELAQMVEK
ncbi:hypothetical protein JCM24511_06525 [Saitozyma sp. JCM 24511]|nr:hypothetical protein JCM24511_06525 [Saitozyma sp. JCM 24511]